LLILTLAVSVDEWIDRRRPGRQAK